MRKIIFTFLFAILAVPAMAQFEIGVSYETRSEEPTNGFGARVEFGVLNWVPLVNFGVRVHGSYFNEENRLTEAGISFSKEITNYDFGAAAVAGLSLGLLEPYVGLGVGFERVDFEMIAKRQGNSNMDLVKLSRDEEESAMFFNTFIGTKIKILPIIRPFVEYRFSNSQISIPDISDTNGRLMLGVSLRF